MDKFQALQKIDFEPGEKPIYLTGEKRYKGFLIAAFEMAKLERFLWKVIKRVARKNSGMLSTANRV